MFGTFRFCLAHMVVLSHLWPSSLYWSGTYAVFAFYTLSGYLICFVLNKTYGFSLKGSCLFGANRILRIYPPYFVALLTSILIVINIPNIALEIREVIRIPNSLSGWFHNIFIFGLNGDKARLVPPAWAVDVELFFYIAMAVILGRNKKISIIWFLFSFIYTIYMIINDFDFFTRYQPLVSASLPFSLGTLIFWFNVQKYLNKNIIFLAVVIFIINTIFANYIWDNPRGFGFYFSLIWASIIICGLSCLERHNMPKWFRVVDRFLGDLSYPVFLCHWQIACIVVYIFYSGNKPSGMTLFFSSLFFVNLLAFLINYFVESNIEKLRKKIKDKVKDIVPA